MTSNWKECKIGDIVEIRRGASPRPIHQFISNKGMPWVKIADATSDNSRYIRKTNEFIIYDGVKHSVLVEPETLIVSNSATPGLPKIMKIQACVHDGWLVFSNYQGLLRDFLYYKFIDIQKKLLNQANGSVFQNLKTDIVKDFDILLPPLETQQKIAKVLSAIDDKIELNNSINNNLEQQAQAIFKSWFIDIKDTDNYSEKFGNLSKDAMISNIADIDMIITDYVANGSFASLKENVTLYQEPNYAYFVRNTDLKSNTFNVYVDEHSYKFLSKSVLFGNEIIISNVGDVGSVFLCPKLDKPMTLGNNIIMLRPTKKEMLYYLYIWFKWSYGQGLIQGIKGGSAQPKFNKTDFKSLPIIIPTKEMLLNFHKIVTPIFESIENILKENKQLIQLRDALLPKLMSGEIDVDKVEV